MIDNKLQQVQDRIAAAARRVGRDPQEIELIAVTKTVPPDMIENVIGGGVVHLGENRVQEALAKQPLLPKQVQWHLIGHLQRNKVKYVIDKFALIHSVDRMALALELNKYAVKQNTRTNILVQVNVANEDTKFGIQPEETKEFVLRLVDMPGIQVLGLMTIAPYVEHPELVRPVFRTLRELQQQLIDAGLPMRYLSMGMTNDFEVAIEEGANLVRIGSAIFGERK